MKRKLLTLFAVLVLIFSLTALYSCGGDEPEEHEHVLESYVSDNNATCTADGTKTAKCKDCDKTDTVTDEGSALGHKFGEYLPDGNATCTEDGKKVAACESCGETDSVTDEGSALGHDYAYTDAGDAHNGDCTRCDSTVSEPHSDTEWFSFTIAELNTTAYTRCCPVCLAVEYKLAGSETVYTAAEFEEYLKSQSGGTIPETVHIHRNITSIPPKAPTCTEDGFEYRIKCLGCGEIIHEKLLPNLGGHNYELTDHKDATCASAGYDKYECSKCEDEYTTPITVEHSYELTDHKDGSCTEDGYDKYVCSVCKDEKTDIIKIEHELETSSTAPTCTEAGSSSSYCKNCDYENSETLPALGHNIVFDSFNDTHHSVKCSRCGEENSSELHTIEEAFINERTVTATHAIYTSIFYYRCTGASGNCGFTIEITRHSVSVPLETDSGEVGIVGEYTWEIVEPTCGSEGLFILYLDGVECARTAIQPTGELGHDYTKQNSGETHHWSECSICGAESDKKEHAFGEDSICDTCGYGCTHAESAPATCKEQAVCNNCGMHFGELAEHTPEDVFAIAPTCTEDGLTALTKCSVCDKVLKAQEVAGKLGHSFTNYTSNNDATCTADGTKTAKCDRCDETESVTDEGSALGHSYGTPEFTWDGYASASAQFVCTRDASHTEAVTAAITSEVTKEPTTTETGTKLYTAAVILLGVTYTDTKTEELPVETAYTREENYIYFGSYPQSAVNDSALNTTLTSLAGTLPTAGNSQAWTSYGYYKGTGSDGSQSNTTDYMWYIDITHGGEKYRGVYFTSYRPYGTYFSSSTSSTYQDDNGYSTSEVYWFKYEPIKWRILTEENGKALLLCEMLIDSQEYYHSESNRTINGSTVYANNYEYSNIRAWLNDNFYNTAFNDMQKALIQLTTVDNSAASTTDSQGNITQATSYACRNTEDYIFLLSEKEVTTSAYGFASSYSTYDTARQKETTDYAQCQGAYTYSGNGYWWLRSPYYISSNRARSVYYDGYAYSLSGVRNAGSGVCPALWISLG